MHGSRQIRSRRCIRIRRGKFNGRFLNIRCDAKKILDSPSDDATSAARQDNTRRCRDRGVHVVATRRFVESVGLWYIHLSFEQNSTVL